ncbi:sigma-70 family RNA polymerase sigma factor [Demequina capsici]|uniref:Sigma-70 family RNA polymerase sigma factor n=1 Tax=Demequina capsici TaxID=3075620 RepID=A0AA96FCJ0_9MICO|nr:MULTISPECIES: sigma-70 family RNA polymerase sigma factor [unclassified Demequina]WNM24429.1 sigma-70 family RNA polymerase sigma factor [Demequina sp. OYTSA14]WNM27263.1 sigma-70 family RNA polymerase sigma factor [Demequina sp. PMTSA13]
MSDQQILAALHAQALPRLGSHAYALTGSYSAAEELVQAAIVKAFSRKRGFRDVAGAEAYVRAAIRTLHLDALRRQARWTGALPVLAREESVDDGTAAVDGADLVARGMATLAPRVRTAIALRYIEDLTVADIAHAMRISEGTVKGYLKEGRARLGSLWGVEAVDDDEVVEVREVRR